MDDEGRLDLSSLCEGCKGPAEIAGFGQALGGPGRKIVVGRDCDPGSRMMCNALIAGLLSVGTEVRDAGVMPAPAAAAASRDCDMLIMVGNPDSVGNLPRWKAFNGDGSPVGLEALREAVGRYNDGEIALQPYDRVGGMHPMNAVAERYIVEVAEAYEGARTPVLLDCGCGSAALCAPYVLSRMGCDITCNDTHSDTLHRPRPPGVSGPEMLRIQESIAHDPGSIGLALNGDGTRLASIDESGDRISAEEVAALIAMRLRPSVLVLPMDMSSLVEDAFHGSIGRICEEPAETSRFGKVVRTGGTLEETVDALRDADDGLGITSEGEFIFPESSFCPDAIRACAILSEIAGICSIKDVLSSFPKYTMFSETLHLTGNVETFNKGLAEALADIGAESIIEIGGWRVTMRNGWFLVSVGGDHGHVNVTSESADGLYALSLMESVKDLVRRCM